MSIHCTAALTERRRFVAYMSFLGLTPALALSKSRFPSKNVHIIIPQNAGGAADRLARIFAEKLEALWGKSVIVENRPGGGVVIGSTAIARSIPDGHIFGILGSSLSINAVQRNDLPYHPLTSFTHLARIGYYTTVLVASKAFPANNIEELVEYAKNNKNNVSFGSNGIGTAAQLSGDLLNKIAGINMLHVPYNGAAQMYTDMVGGVIPLGFAVASSAEPFVKSGQLKVLGVTSLKRSRLYPEWPTISETYPGYEVLNWAGFCGPAGIDGSIRKIISNDINKMLKDDSIIKIMSDMGIEVMPLEFDEFEKFVLKEMDVFKSITSKIDK